MSRGPEDYFQSPFPASIQSATGNASFVALPLIAGISVVSVQIAGTWSGTLVFEASQDSNAGQASATWFPVNAVSAGNSFQTLPSTTTNGNFFVLVGGYTSFRVRASALASGAPKVYLVGQASQPAAGFVVGNTQPQNFMYVGPSGPVGTQELGRITNLDAYRSLLIYLQVNGLAGTTPTLDLYLQSSPDGGSTWYDVCHYPQITTATGVGYFVSLTRGDSNVTTPRVVNFANNTPVLAVNTLIPDGLGNAVRSMSVVGGTITTQATVSFLCIAGSQ